MKISTILTTSCALALFIVANTQAATLASYPFTGQSLASTDPNAASTAGDVVLDTGLTDATAIRFSASGNPGAALRVNSDETDGATFAAANIANDDFTFTITPVAGAKLVLDTLSFDLAVSGLTAGSNVRVQLSGTGNTFATLGTIMDYTATTFALQSFDLTPANATLAAGLPVYVRFLVFDAANSATAYTAFDNIAVTGSVTAIVPEPRTYVLLTLGALATVGMSIRRRATT